MLNYISTMSQCSQCLEESLSLELLNPSLAAVLRKVILVILVKHKSAELVITQSLGVRVHVSISGGEPEHLASLGREQVVKLSSGITVVIAVSLLVAHSENCNLLSLQVDPM